MFNLLIADDTPLISATIARTAREGNLGFDTIVEARNGLEAVELARKIHPHIVIMDIRMPGMDGLRAAEIIRSEFPKTKIVFLTAYDEFSYAQAALKIGSADYLLKPVRPTEFLTVLKRLVDDLLRDNAALEKTAAEAGSSALLKRDPASRAIAYIQQYYDRPSISLNELAKVAHLSPSHLAYVLKEKLGMSYKQYVTMQRLDAAKRLLQTTDWTIDTIAEQVGYPNVTNFYRLFQRETGQTPAAYRKQGVAGEFETQTAEPV